jgi:hypothetical protein
MLDVHRETQPWREWLELAEAGMERFWMTREKASNLNQRQLGQLERKLRREAWCENFVGLDNAG